MSMEWRGVRPRVSLLLVILGLKCSAKFKLVGTCTSTVMCTSKMHEGQYQDSTCARRLETNNYNVCIYTKKSLQAPRGPQLRATSRQSL